jgi:nucleoside-diphosphate-sugar epimerase
MKSTVDLHIHPKHAKGTPDFPGVLDDVAQLEELLSRPTPRAVDVLGCLTGDIIVLGAGGKMGPTLARMAKRASDAAGIARRVIGVKRDSPAEDGKALEPSGVEVISGDLLDPGFVASLPEVPNVIFMAGRKFGCSGNEPLTWAVNTYMPALVCRKFHAGRIVAFSTGNVYGLSPVEGDGSHETDPPNPCGEYAMSCLGRERIFEHFSRSLGIPTALIRLNYAVEMRYGVLVDLARKVLLEQEIDLTTGYVNVIWQGDAAAMVLCALGDAAVPARHINIAGPELLSVREICQTFAKNLGKTARFTGVEAEEALLSDGRAAIQRYGPPQVSAEQMIRWIGRWISRGSPTWEKPTLFEVRNGVF